MLLDVSDVKCVTLIEDKCKILCTCAEIELTIALDVVRTTLGTLAVTILTGCL